MTKRQIIHTATVIGYAAAFGIGYVLHTPSALAAAPVPVADKASDTAAGNLNSLRLECARLRSENDALKADVRKLTAAADNKQVPQPVVNISTPETRAAEQAERRARREKERRERSDRMQIAFSKLYTKQADFLKDIDMSLLSEAQRNTHIAYTSANDTRSALAAKMSAGEQLTPEEREAYNNARRTIAANRAKERDLLIDALGTSMGMTKEDSAALGTLIRDIYSTTSNRTKVTNGNSTVISIEM